ncbi:MAG: molybdenum cofactor guanylyltransferase MobA [Pseudomonadota bacterium]
MNAPTLAVVLAGGRARRMGGADKALLPCGDRPLIARVIERVAPQCQAVVVNANGDPARFESLGLPVVADAVPGQPGPLAGILAGMERAAANRPPFLWLLSVPCDAPFLPTDLVARLHATAARSTTPVVRAVSGGQPQHVVALWLVDLRPALRTALGAGVRSVGAWAEARGVADVIFDPAVPGAPDPFLNVNTAAELEAATRMSCRN